ncbi:hypothetical protein AB9K35_17760 [Leisingera sp. XS_AS12]|uniref:hypothetical protein n=1 Tax=Leisingera sp. XS_AS12 TaxID=3241294 RepID=UPI003513DEB9
MKVEPFLLQKSESRPNSFSWHEQGYPAKDGTCSVALYQNGTSWNLSLSTSRDGDPGNLVVFEVDGPDTRTGGYASQVLNILAATIGNETCEETVRQAIASHPLSRGFALEGAPQDILSPPLTPRDVERLVRDCVDTSCRQNWLRGLEVLSRDPDNGRVFLRADLEGARKHLTEQLSTTPGDTDLIVAAESYGMVPLYSFFLGRNPVFDVEAGVLHGVSEARAFNGDLVHHGDLWVSQLIMTRLEVPGGAPEDLRFRIECALDKIWQDAKSQSTPAPSGLPAP